VEPIAVQSKIVGIRPRDRGKRMCPVARTSAAAANLSGPIRARANRGSVLVSGANFSIAGP